MYKNNGSIHIDELTIRLKEYLQKEGHDTSIADQLFDIMKERVCALISRVQGTFEFEVQPLREYFCAKHLYKSAPHSSAGSVKQGTKPDRLHAILRNFYWQNVVRFFAGCADAGELDMIIQELKDLHEDELLKYTNYPQIITSQILSDYVFAQKPLKLNNVIQIIIDGINIGQNNIFSSDEPLLLPNECGKIELIKDCFQQLTKLPKNDYALELIGIIHNNQFDILDDWLKLVPTFKGEELTTWLEYAYRLGLMHKIEESLLQTILKEENDIKETKKRIQCLIDGGRLEIINKDIGLKNIIFKSILNNDHVMFVREEEYSLSFLSMIFQPFILSNIIMSDEENISFINYFEQYLPRETTKTISQFIVNDDIDNTVKELSNALIELFDHPITDFKNSIKLWDILVEKERNIFKENWSIKIVATIAAGIKSKSEVYDDYSELNNSSLSLCKRTRCARMKSGNIKYWEMQLSDNKDKLFSLLVFFTWATSKVIIQLLPLLLNIIKSLDTIDIGLLIRAISHTVGNSRFNKSQQKFIIKELERNNTQDIIKYIVSLRFDYKIREEYIYNHVSNFDGIFEGVINAKFQYLIRKFMNKPSTKILNEIKEIYKNIACHKRLYYRRHRFAEKTKMPYKIAVAIMKEYKEYPIIISSVAEKTCRRYANEKFKAVGETAKIENWFEEN